MFTTAVAFDGERWDGVAYRAYGDATLSNTLIAANPTMGITDRLVGGTVLIIPILPSQPDVTNASLLPPWKQ